ncbi:alpha/beta fold hydrolase [Geodermatophilus sp. DSM 45219]|uniref:alpha/beta fold hydrolase n=1 Tax=Geodermatophilus sp. DSM 45219 TaxID=1881103 RepID=UPI00088AA8AF|nr:alpha/beta hydrolase [Geodermatophilus sp. DSM 45219]SDN76233.1 Pimeloyl-ACP methyl ester carboxylesterase [Geodermatophilus sp. DSM 45219]
MTDVTSSDGTRLALVVEGPDDAPTVVLVHGLGLSTDSWGDVPARLAGAHRVVGYDLRGHAQSGDARTGDYSLEAHARDLDAVLAACVPAGERAVVVGHSLGGGIVLAAARRSGTARMAGVVFAGSGGSGVTAPGLPARSLPAPLAAALQRGWFGVLRAAALVGHRVRGVEAVSDALVRRSAFAPGEPAELVARVRESFLTTRPRALAGTTLASLSHDGTRLAPHLDVPTLVVHGTADREVPEDEVRDLLSALPDAELVSVPRAGHVLPLTHGPLVAEQVARWVARTSPARPTSPQEAS